MPTRSSLVVALLCAAAASLASAAAAQDAAAELAGVVGVLEAIGCEVVSDAGRSRLTIHPSTPSGRIPTVCFRAAMHAMNVTSAVRLEQPGGGALVAETRRTDTGGWPLRRWRRALGTPAPLSFRHPIERSLEPLSATQ